MRTSPVDCDIFHSKDIRLILCKYRTCLGLSYLLYLFMALKHLKPHMNISYRSLQMYADPLIRRCSRAFSFHICIHFTGYTFFPLNIPFPTDKCRVLNAPFPVQSRVKRGNCGTGGGRKPLSPETIKFG